MIQGRMIDDAGHQRRQQLGYSIHLPARVPSGAVFGGCRPKLRVCAIQHRAIKSITYKIPILWVAGADSKWSEIF